MCGRSLLVYAAVPNPFPNNAMRGFPLLNVVLVVAFFVLAWWPLKQAIGEKAPAMGTADTVFESSEEGGFSLTVTSSHPLASLTVSHLNVPLFSIASPGEAIDELEMGHEIEGIEVPPEGIELWIKATFAGTGIDDQRPVLGLELIPEDVEHEIGAVTLWGDLGEPVIDAPAVFVWKGAPDQP